MKRIVYLIAAALLCAACSTNGNSNMNKSTNDMTLTQEWDKTFPKSEKVEHRKITFTTRYGDTIVADMYIPKTATPATNATPATTATPTTTATPASSGTTEKLPAIAVCGPFGAVKEQCSGLYAQTMAERGFLTIAFDPSHTGESGNHTGESGSSTTSGNHTGESGNRTGESGSSTTSGNRTGESTGESTGEARNVASPDINTEDFCAAIDYLSTNDLVDPERIGILGICGWGGLALNTAAIDTRIKATVTSTMYDMSRVNANGYFDSLDEDARYELKKQLNAQRTEDYRNGTPKLAGGLPDTVPDDAPFFLKDYFAYYKTERGYHPRSLNSNNGWNVTSALSFMNMPQLTYTDEIRSAVLMIHGEKAHSCYFSRDAYAKMTSGKGQKWSANKELLIIPDAVHTDLYDNLQVIPFDRIEQFYKENLKK